MAESDAVLAVPSLCCHSHRSAASFAAVAVAPTAVAARRCFAANVDADVAAALDILQQFVLLSNFVRRRVFSAKKWRQTWRPFGAAFPVPVPVPVAVADLATADDCAQSEERELGKE